ncbi:hypothetical protein T09_8630 [Trichinella sp. T9]|uniref:Uncharacterized protein n=1 Tax=Trichinella murrelli TaxID=144512 RepID=A0A0V0TZH2_9BILA|nr:hypothetical protein T05_9734 [Trichinella murrelli]KRX63528.1 hypothetical protein T09_8630 [Trichinella sp. T9]KRZ92660.1 hypothetical protein T08_811 [Trichinella sp. T8]
MSRCLAKSDPNVPSYQDSLGQEYARIAHLRQLSHNAVTDLMPAALFKQTDGYVEKEKIFE